MLFWGTESEIQGHRGLRECSSEGDGIKSLCANGESLKQVRCFPRIAGDGGHAATQLSQELTACAVDGAQRFDSHRDKIVSGRKVGIFASFSVRSVLCCASRRYRRQVDIGGRARVDGCCVPSNILAPRQRNKSSSVRSFAVFSDQSWWFLRAWDVRFHQGSPDDIVHGEVTGSSTRRSLTNQPVVVSGFRKIAIRSRKFVWRVRPRLLGLSERCL